MSTGVADQPDAPRVACNKCGVQLPPPTSNELTLDEQLRVHNWGYTAGQMCLLDENTVDLFHCSRCATL